MNREEKAIKLIKKVAKSINNPLFAGNSGGKDSAVVDKLLQLSGVDYESFYTNTTLDPPKTISHIRKYYPHTKILQPKESFFKLVERKGFPTRLSRYCCELLKEYGSIGKAVFEGVRSCESNKRQGRDYIQCDTRKWQKKAQHIYPIYDWSDEDVYSFIKKHNIKLAPHYATGAKRLGCVGCPLVRRKDKKTGKTFRELEFEQYPRYYQLIKKAIDKGMRKNPQWKLTCATDGDAQKAMDWWIKGNGATINEYFNRYSFEKNKNGWTKKLI